MKKNNEINNRRGIRLKECRKAAHLTQEMLSMDSNYSVQTISYIENGRRGLSVDAARTFSKSLKVRMQYLLCEDDFKTYGDLLLTPNAIEKKEKLILDVFTEYGYLSMRMADKRISNHTDHKGGKNKVTTSINKYTILTPDGRYVICSEDDCNDMINNIIAYIKSELEKLTQNCILATTLDIQLFNKHP